MTIGTASIIVGAVLIVITVIMGEKIGLGTLLNMVLIGLFLDFLMNLTLIPVMSGWLTGLALLVAGLFVISVASYFYIGSGFGAGPRDSLMVALTRKTGKACPSRNSPTSWYKATIFFTSTRSTAVPCKWVEVTNGEILPPAPN